MLKPVPMRKIRVIGLRKDMEAAVGLLHELGTVQFSKYDDIRLSPEKPLEIYPVITEQLVRMRGIEAALKPRAVQKKPKLTQLDDLLGECASIDLDKRLGRIKDRLDAIGLESKELDDALLILGGLAGLEIDLSIARSKETCFFVGRIPNGKLATLDGSIRAATDRFALKTRKLNNLESVCAIVADRKHFDYIGALLLKSGFAEAKLPPLSGKPDEVLSEVNTKLAQLGKEKQELVKEVEALSDKHYSKVTCMREMLEIYSDRAHAPSNFSRTAHTFLFEGWVPASGFQQVASALNSKFGNDLVIQEAKATGTQPTLLNNPSVLGPFEFLVEFISLPKGNEIDPTLLFAFVFPLFYGMMLGDVGYGLVSLLIALLIMKKFKRTMLEPIAKVWAYSSVPAMLFGVIYDEYFGFRHFQLIGTHLYEGMLRMENINTLLLLTLVIGVAHLTFGYLLGAINAYKKRHWWHMAAKLGWISLEFSGIALVMTVMFQMLPDFVTIPAALLAIISLVPIAKAEGLTGLIEIPGLASGIFSYARILAVGIASVVMAELINELLLPKPEQGLLMLLFIPIYLGLHLFNIVLGMFESLVQGARLNYVEFFSKFYEGGGEKFNPFKYAKRFTV